MKNTGNVIDYNVYFNGALSSVIDGGHSIGKDPLLISASTGDLHLAAGSPAIDKGDGAVGANAGALDIDGDPRVKGTIDIGADER
jgi:serralysin